MSNCLGKESLNSLLVVNCNLEAGYLDSCCYSIQNKDTAQEMAGTADMVVDKFGFKYLGTLVVVIDKVHNNRELATRWDIQALRCTSLDQGTVIWAAHRLASATGKAAQAAIPKSRGSSAVAGSSYSSSCLSLLCKTNRCVHCLYSKLQCS